MLKHLAQKLSDFSTTPLATTCLFLLTYAAVILSCPAIGISLLVLYITLLCLYNEDVLPIVFPLFLIYFICLVNYGTANVWLVWLCLPCGLSIVYRMVKNRRALRPGETFFGLLAVSAALLCGGIGSITAAEYFSPGALYTVFGLSALVIFFYFFLRCGMAAPRRYHVGDYISTVMYLGAVFVAFLLLRVFIMHPEILDGRDAVVHRLEQLIPWRNGASNFGIVALPFIFYYARRHSPWHLLSAVLIYASISLAGARAAIVVGALMLLLGFFYFSYQRPILRAVIVVSLLALCIVALVFLQPILTFFEDFLCISFDNADFRNESRYKLLLRAVQDFCDAPIFGRGLGYTGNADLIESGLAGSTATDRLSIYWYHSLIPQIMGSMGIFGLLAYGYQLFLRLRAFFTARRTPFVGALFLAYIGILVYSMLEPGIFSPLPFALLTVLLIVLLEQQEKRTVSQKA